MPQISQDKKLSKQGSKGKLRLVSIQKNGKPKETRDGCAPAKDEQHHVTKPTKRSGNRKNEDKK